jgi:hypothetical protein
MGITDRLHQCVSPLAGWLPICNTNNKNRLLELIAANLGNHQRVENTLAKSSAEWGESVEALLRHQLFDLLIGANPAEHVWWNLVIVHEADFDAIIVEECSCESDLQNN